MEKDREYSVVEICRLGNRFVSYAHVHRLMAELEKLKVVATKKQGRQRLVSLTKKGIVCSERSKGLMEDLSKR
jgi:predicted transcriptional regulator